MKKTLLILLIAIAASHSFGGTVTGLGSTFVITETIALTTEQRTAFEAAAKVWADILVSPVDIAVSVEFTDNLAYVSCNSNSAVLGSAGPISWAVGGYTGSGIQDNVWYPAALINSKVGSDLFTVATYGANGADIVAHFNSDIGDADCLATQSWNYDVGGDSDPNTIDFYEVALHELGHGLGILSLILYDGTNGFFNSGLQDIYSQFLRDDSLDTDWTSLTDAQRGTSITSNGDLVWNGTEVNALAGDLTSGVHADGHVRMNAPATYSSGSSVGHFDTALDPDELMEPEYTGGATYDHSVALLKDIGWDIYVPANAQPVITGQSSLATDEDTALTIALADLTVTDTDNTYPTDFSLTVASGTNYTVSGDTITPTAHFNGTLTVPVTVNDGTIDSASYDVSVTVNAVNDKPVISAQASLSLNEDSSLLLAVADLTITDPDHSTFTLTVASGSNYTFSGNTITPIAHFNGTLTVPVVVNDGEIDSDNFNVTVTVNAQNDAPAITASPSLSLDEDTSLLIDVADFTITDVDSGSFTLDVAGGTNYTVSGTTITPATHYFGNISVDVRAYDGAAYSSIETLTITVDPVNDAPVITSTPSTLIIVEDNYLHQFVATDVENQSLTYSLVSGPSWLTVTTAGGLSGTPSLSDTGVFTIEVSVTDSDLTDSISFDITVTDSISSDLSLNLSSDAVLVDEANSIVLSASVSHTGPAALASGQVAIDVDASVVIQTIDASCTLINATQVQCDFSDLAQGGVASFDISLTSNNPATLNVFGEVMGSQNDPIAANNLKDTTLFFQAASYATPIATVDSIGTMNSAAVAVGDLNGNGWQEFVFANGSTQQSEIYEFNGGYDTMVLLSTLPDTLDSNDAVLVDVDKINGLDIVFANGNGDANVIYLNNGNAGFTESQTLGNQDSEAVVVADFNGDGWVDLAFANSGSSANTIYLNDQTGQFVLSASLGSEDSRDVAVIDFNQDGWDDLVFANVNEDNLIYLNNGSDQTAGIFDASAVLLGTQVQNSHSVLVADLNGDGTANNIVIGDETTDGNASVTVYEVSNTQQISVVSQFDSGDVVSLSAGIINDDALLDLSVVNSEGIMQLMLQNGVGDFVREDILAAATNQSALLVDVDEDELADTVLVREGSAGNALFLNPRILSAPVEEVIVVIETTTIDTSTGVQTNETSVLVVKSSGSLGLYMLVAMMVLLLARRKNIFVSR